MDEEKFSKFVFEILDHRYKNNGDLPNIESFRKDYKSLSEDQARELNFYNYCFDIDKVMVMIAITDEDSIFRPFMRYMKCMWNIHERILQREATELASTIIMDSMKIFGLEDKFISKIDEIMNVLNKRDDLSTETKAEFTRYWFEKNKMG